MMKIKYDIQQNRTTTELHASDLKQANTVQSIWHGFNVFVGKNYGLVVQKYNIKSHYKIS